MLACDPMLSRYARFAQLVIPVNVPVGHGISHNPIAANLIWEDSGCNPNPALNALLSPSPLVAVP